MYTNILQPLLWRLQHHEDRRWLRSRVTSC